MIGKSRFQTEMPDDLVIDFRKKISAGTALSSVPCLCTRLSLTPGCHFKEQYGIYLCRRWGVIQFEISVGCRDEIGDCEKSSYTFSIYFTCHPTKRMKIEESILPKL